mmetsp:Transcript_7352/g.13939  ORF Transcript_7352/g.13939 Transcript_7352/m.13939 type:complete len:620 (-) Transcript_7352:51-1910(-)
MTNKNNNNEKVKAKDDKVSCCSWKGILIEADTEKFQSLSNLHHPLGNKCWNETVSCLKHSKQSLSYLLKNRALDDHVLPMNFEFLCIDVDGTDYWLLHDILHASFRPQVICIEFNPTMPHDLLYIQPRDDTIRHGSSLSALVALANEFHYQLVECTCYNVFFVDSELYEAYVKDQIPFEPTVDTVHEVTMGTALYQLYDGTLKLHGCKTMLWHRLPIPDIQVLEKEERSFPFVPGTAGPSLVEETEQKHELVTSSLTSSSSLSCEQDLSEQVMFQSISVDMSPYCQTGRVWTEEEQVRCSQELMKQLETDGFALVSGTAISRELCRDALHWTNLFLHQASEPVRRSCLTKDRARRGYSPQNAENFASLIGEKGPNDLVKKFRVGPDMMMARAKEEEKDGVHQFDSLGQPNAWPVGELWGEENSKTFQKVIEEYYEKICKVAHTIVTCIRDGIRNSSKEVLPHLDESLAITNESHTSILTLLGYRKGARHQGCKIPLVAAHTDVGVITVLLFDDGDCAALQRSEGDSWVDVRLPRSVPSDPIFVVNIGDCLSDLCDGRLPSTMHRVMPRNGKEGKPRNTLALFVGFRSDQKLCINNKLVTYEEWRKIKIAKAQAKARELS